MFVCKLRTPSCANYEHCYVYLAYGRQTGTVLTRQTYDRAPSLTKTPTAHISKGEYIRAPDIQYMMLLSMFPKENISQVIMMTW